MDMMLSYCCGGQRVFGLRVVILTVVSLCMRCVLLTRSSWYVVNVDPFNNTDDGSVVLPDT